MASVLITGTSKGIGYESALAFARAGFTVHATMRNPSAAPGLAEVAAAERLRLTVTTLDVDSDASVQQAIAAIEQQHGPIDILVNNAGVERFGAIEEVSIEDFRAVMETNYFGVLRCIKAVIPTMRSRRSGTILNVSSVAGRFSHGPATPYCASKWALEALCEGLATEMKMFGVRVLLIEPGIIDTDMARRIASAAPSPYPQGARMAAVFTDTLTNAPVPPSLVAAKILDVAQSGTWQFRHLVGPDAEGLIAWRKSMTDEQWIDLHASDDEEFVRRMSTAA